MKDESGYSTNDGLEEIVDKNSYQCFDSDDLEQGLKYNSVSLFYLIIYEQCVMGTKREGMIKKEGLQSSVISVTLKIIQFINIGNAGRNQNLRSECWI